MNRMLSLIFILLYLLSCNDKSDDSFENRVHAQIVGKIDSLSSTLKLLEGARDKETLLIHFKESRKEYKKIELFVEYYFQGLSRRINGPALPEIKTDDNIVNEASGYQVIEEIVYSDKVDLVELKKQLKILKTDLNFIRQNFKDMPVQDHHFYEAVQHQIIRIAALGITGFDSPVAFNSIEEAKYAIEGIEEFYQIYGDVNSLEVSTRLIETTKRATQYIEKNKHFNSFDRLEFIKNQLMPLSIAFEDEFKSVIEAVPHFGDNKVFSGHLADLMVGKKLNPDAFSPFAASGSTAEKTALGKILFHNAELSRSRSMSCASCHSAEKAFTDSKISSNANIHSTSVRRNSPTLLYSGLQKSFFYDMRSQDLENQIESVMKSPDEFNLSPEGIQKRVSSNTRLLQLFKKAYPESKEITPYEIRNALASYVRNLMPFNSKIDQFFRGEASLTESEKNGFNLFAGKAKCATCHFIPIYNGTVPPWYNNTESEVIGVPGTIAWENAKVDVDEGRYKLNQLEPLKFSFKTPTVRNVALTAPYMHNGVFNTLNQVVKFYDRGGGNGIGMKLEHQTLPFEKLDLTEKEQQDIIQFLKTLTDGKK